jgi:hypothetical protein
MYVQKIFNTQTGEGFWMQRLLTDMNNQGRLLTALRNLLTPFTPIPPVTRATQFQIAIEVVSGLEYLHNHDLRIVHG